MRRRWHWDFDDDQRPRRVPATPPPVPAAPVPAPAPVPPPLDAPARRTRFRLRRATAALVAALLVALVVALSGSSHHRSTPAGAHPLALRAHPGVPAFDEGRVVSSTLAYTPFVREGGPTGREIALTFDDGPGPYTPQLLSVLEREHVRATFFPIGRMERYFGESTVRELNDGDVVGNHTETHPLLARLSAREQHEELFEQMVRIELVGGPRPRLFRPPYGSFNATTLRELRAFGLLMVLWSADTGDYQQPGVPVIVERALAGAHPGAIILMHDGGGDRSQTIAALPEIIHGLRHRGYHFVTVPQLLADDPAPHGQPLPSGLSGD
jgi:peptidoglycan/xylan/chitin deacetylase (PgdA/CDA1 family)